MKKEVIFYRTVDKKCPVEEFLDSLSAKAAQKVTWVFNLFEDFEILPKTYFMKMTSTDDLWECRVKLGSNIYRIFAFFDHNKVVLTHGIAKKSQKTPRREIERAENYKKDYFQRLRR